MPPPHVRLFVYGTLMTGEEGHELLREARLVGAVRTEPRYLLVDMGPYPALLAEGSSAVTGELYELPRALLGDVDRFEGHPELYERGVVALEGGTTAQAYFLAPRLRAAHPEIPGGDWKKHRA